MPGNVAGYRVIANLLVEKVDKKQYFLIIVGILPPAGAIVLPCGARIDSPLFY